MDARLAQRAPARPEPELPLLSGHEVPVFVDHSGRRARRVRVAGALLAGLCALWLAGLVMGMAGFSGFPVVRSPIGGLAALARAGIARAEARELAGTSVAGREHEVNAVNRRSRGVCLAAGAGAGAPIAAGRRHATSHGGTGRPACSTKAPVGLRRNDPRLT